MTATATTTTTMRDLTMPSPPEAFTLSTGKRIDENQNDSGVTKKFQNDSPKKEFFSDASSDGTKENHENNESSKNPPTLYENSSPQSEDMENTGKDDRVVRWASRSTSRTLEAEGSSRRKHRSVNNNESTEEEPQCPVCGKDFSLWPELITHLRSDHPERELVCELCRVTFDEQSDLEEHRARVHKPAEVKKKPPDPPKVRLDRKTMKNIPKVIGFQDINFIDFSSEKFPLVAKDVCEKSLHLSKDDFSFNCQLCGRGFPCASALEIHEQTCEKKKEVIKKNKRKSTPQFRPQKAPSETDESDDSIEHTEVDDKRRNDFFSSLHLKTNESTSKTSSQKIAVDETTTSPKKSYETKETKDLADIESMISVTNIPGIQVKNFPFSSKQKSEEKSNSLNIQIDNNQCSPRTVSSMSVGSPNFSVLNLISPNHSGSDYNEEEAQDCFAAECRRMKLRGEFPCKLCTQIFPNLRALKGHNRVHVSVASGTPNSPYRCNICPYNSLDKATLVRHMRSHNGDRPYECAMCNYAFTTKANCERHLRNRHSKMTRDDVKSSIIYHPSEDPINDSEYMKTSEMNKKNAEKTKEIKQEFSLPMNLKINLAALKERQKSEDLFQAEHQQMLKTFCNGSSKEHFRMEAGTMTEDVTVKFDSPPIEEPWSGEQALDLRVNKYKYDTPPSECSDEPEDLTKKHIQEFNNNIEIKNKEELSAFPSPPFEPKQPEISTLVKMYSAMYPSLSMAQVHQIILTQLNFPGLFQRLAYPPFLMPPSVFQNAPYPKTLTSKDSLGLQMSGGAILDEKNSTSNKKFQYFQQESLHHDYKSPDAKSSFNEYFTETDKKTFQEIIVNREPEKNPAFLLNKPSESTSDSKNSSVKMVIKNGILMPKQKQRRYRTERPFSCEHCSARFTLRSNMERHIKQQHPRFWTQKSRYNVGQGRKSESRHGLDDYYRSYEASNSRGEVTSSAGGDVSWDASKSPQKIKTDEEESDGEELKDGSDEEGSKDELIIDEEHGHDHLSLLANVTEYLKAKETAEEQAAKPTKEPQQDLASVSKMLDNAVTQTQAFQKYFQEGTRKEEEDTRRQEEAERSEEEEGLIAGSTSSDENRSESEVTSKTTKKKSAYSLAPNRVSCPYCFRKFPWTSSLRRHVLTHTGQKPFKCTHCPLLFTTKSNCDRHLLRKHGREALIASSGQTENHDVSASGPAQTPSGSSQTNNNVNLRNVPERPYKCTHCPASTFSSLSNLTKHISSKHSDGQKFSPERSGSPELSYQRVKNINPLAPPNVTITPTFPINIPKALSIIPQYPAESFKAKRFPINVPSIKVQEWGTKRVECDEESRGMRKRSSSEETDATEKKRMSPDNLKVSPVTDFQSDSDQVRSDLPLIPASELPFKCHLCESSFGERNEALEHIRFHHPGEFQLLMSKGALETNSEEDRVPHDDHDDIEHSRGRFPDYAHRKVMCAFCLRRFWSAEDLRRHMRTHTGERPFSCDVCHRKFTLKHSMLRHRKKHNAHDEVIIGSDEEQQVGSTTPGPHRSFEEEANSPPKTILHQTLTRKDDEKNTKVEVKVEVAC